MAERGSKSVTERSEFDLVITRVFGASRKLVWKAWTDPKQLAQWWGPHEFTNPVCELDVRPGGAIRIHMRGPDGTVYPMTGVYQTIVEPERLVFTSAVPDDKGRSLFEVLTIVTFAEQGGKTTQTLQARVVKKTAAAAPYLAGMEAGWTQSLERLDAYVATRKNGSAEDTADREIVITRVFDAPRELVWKAWTERERLMQWFGPKGFTMSTAKLDFRPGGVFHYCLRSPDGHDM